MNIKNNYNHTIFACYIGYITQAIINNFIPLLFVMFHEIYDISLEKIASASGLSPKYFGSVFKKLNGVTPWEYVTSKRINLAIDIVTSKEYSSMLSVAKMCGYHNTASFNKAFRKNTGVVPSKYISAIGEYEKSGEM